MDQPTSGLSSVVHKPRHVNRLCSDSLAYILLACFCNELFIFWVFSGSTSWCFLRMKQSLPTSLFLWLISSHILFVVWVGSWLFRGRISVPCMAYLFLLVPTIASGIAIQWEFVDKSILSIGVPLVIFSSCLLAIFYTDRKDRLALGLQLLLSSCLGILSGMLHVYLLATAG